MPRRWGSRDDGHERRLQLIRMTLEESVNLFVVSRT